MQTAKQNENKKNHIHSNENNDLPLRFDWKIEEILKIYNSPLLDLMHNAHSVHKLHHPENTVQLASLLNIKTGSCPEDCKYCSQSAHYAKKTGLKKEPLMNVEKVLQKAKEAKASGATRFCMGAARRNVKNNDEFEQVLEMVRGVKNMGMEACVTLGMLTQEQADKLAKAGLTSYNHNVDTSPEYYNSVITTRTFQDRLDTIQRVRKAGITVCSGGIIGMGESVFDRARMLQVLSHMNPHPESVPVNALVAIKGTPLEDRPPVDPIEMIRMVATARMVMPRSRIRLSAGRKSFSKETQIMCMFVGANSIFYGDKLLTTENNDTNEDLQLLSEAGMKPCKADA